MYTQGLNNLQYAFIQPVSQTSKNYYPFASNLIKNCTSFNFQQEEIDTSRKIHYAYLHNSVMIIHSPVYSS